MRWESLGKIKKKRKGLRWRGTGKGEGRKEEDLKMEENIYHRYYLLLDVNPMQRSCSCSTINKTFVRSWRSCCGFLQAKRKPPGWPAVCLGLRCVCLTYALASPAALRCENQKYVK